MERFGKEKLQFLLVVIIFLFGGIFTTHCFESGTFMMGKEITTEEIGKVEETAAVGAWMVRININTASAEELVCLSGIGEARAADIIAYREEHGNFSRIEDITKISGIGEKTFEGIKEQITVGD